MLCPGCQAQIPDSQPLLPAMRRRPGACLLGLWARQRGRLALLRAMRGQARRAGARRRGAPAAETRAGCAARSRRGRAPPAHRDVLRSGRLDRAVDQARSGRPARGDRRLPQMRGQRRRALRRFRRQIYGRRRAGLFRLSRKRTRPTPRTPCARGWRSSRRSRRRESAKAAIRCASASPPGWWWSASWSAAGKRRSATSSARRRTSRRGCNRPPRPTAC